jgi:hypothetical protein
MSVKSYDPANVSLVFAGIIVEGYADGTFVTAARSNPSFSLKVGSSGEGARAKSNDKSGTVTFTLMQSSKSNDELSAQALLDELSGDGIGAFLMKDNQGTTLCSAETAWLQKPADAEYAKEISDRQWVIETDVLNMLVGGNT